MSRDYMLYLDDMRLWPERVMRYAGGLDLSQAFLTNRFLPLPASLRDEIGWSVMRLLMRLSK